MMKKSKCIPVAESLFTQPKKKSKERDGGGESANPPLYSQSCKPTIPHAPFLYKKQAKKNENSRSIEQSFDWAPNR